MEGWFYDGENAVRYQVSVEASGGDLVIRFGDGVTITPPPGQLCHVESRRDCEIYGRADIQGWRLGLPGEMPKEIATLLPRRQRYGRLIDRFGLLPTVAIGLLVSAAVLFAGWRAPQWLAPHIPEAWEKSYGDTLVGDFGGKFCTGPGGQAALKKLAARISPGSERLNMRVVDIDIVNAAALPGGNVVLFEQLLTEAKGPDEVAGVLAHEVAHVERRHVTQAMIRELGFGLVITALGGTTGGNVNSVLGAGYSRGSEREADADAIAKLRAAKVSPLPTAGFFERLSKDEARLGKVATGLSYISTHPLSAERQKNFRASEVKGAVYTPALSEAEWQALRDICRNDPENVRERAKRPRVVVETN
ncbi:MAG TPA: M48 family metallopeptidase [Allosphingosinicella sp.]